MEIRTLLVCVQDGEAAALAQALESDVEEPHLACTTAHLSCASATAALLQPHVGVVDAEGGLDLMPQLTRASAHTRWLLRGAKCSAQRLNSVVRIGAAGWFERAGVPHLLARAIRVTHAGAQWYSRKDLFEALRVQMGCLPQAPITTRALTRREDEILHLIGEGLSNKEIGRRLQISDQTVKTHLHHVYAKLHQTGRFKAFLTQPQRGTAEA